MSYASSLKSALSGRAFYLALIISLLGNLFAVGAEEPLRICLLSACAEYESDKSLAEFQKYIESKYQVMCHRVFGNDKGDSLPGLEALDNCDLMLVFTRRIQLPADQLERIKKYLKAGRPIVGIRTASHAFQNYLEFDREVLGGGYTGHYSDSVAEISLVADQKAHPILAGVTPFASRRLYKNPSLGTGVTVLMEGSIPDHREPVAWVRENNGRRVFYTSLGVQEDFSKESFRRLLVNAIFWTTHRSEANSRRGSAQ